MKPLPRTRSQRGHSDFGMVMWVLIIAGGVSFTMMFMGWIRGIKDRRHGIRNVSVEEYEAIKAQEAEAAEQSEYYQ